MGVCVYIVEGKQYDIILHEYNIECMNMEIIISNLSCILHTFPYNVMVGGTRYHGMVPGTCYPSHQLPGNQYLIPGTRYQYNT